jgi:hypothetical protein
MAETIHTNQFLTNFATGYKLANPVADFVAPPILVKRPADKYAKYTKSINRVYNNKVSGNKKADEINWDVTEGTYNCEEYSLSKGVDWRKRRNADQPINLDYDAVRFLKRAQAISREKRIYDIAGSTSVVTNYVNAGGDWNTASTGAPIDDILTGMQVVLNANGGYAPNRILIPTGVALEMIKTTNWKSYFQYTSVGFERGLFSAIDGLRNLGLEPMLTSVFGGSTYEISGSDPSDEVIWSDSVLIFYCEPTPTLESRTFMYSPYTQRDLIDTEIVKRERRDVHTIYEEIDELLVDASCAYLITNTLT